MIACENIVKIYKVADLEVVALQGLDLNIETGELVGIIGSSGSGKSTLLNMLGGLDRPSAGKLFIDGKDMLRMTNKDLVKYKRETVGFVWQNNGRNLIPYLTAEQNVELPMLLKGKHKKERARELLERVGLEKRMKNRLGELSGGEQQRVAIAIALANEPRLLLADEPTGSVDTITADLIMDIFQELNQTLNLTIVIVTHDDHLSKKVNRVVSIRDGRTSSEILRRASYLDIKREIDEEERKHQLEEEENTHDEFAVLDSAGRLQLPEDYLKVPGFSGQNKVKVVMEDGRILLYPPERE
jgi:ABC-type lipoprotein export system ATPase subunit